MIINLLTNYTNLKAEISLIKSRILYLENLITMDDLTDLHYMQHRNYRKPLYKNPTASAVVNKDYLTKITAEEIQSDIQKQNTILADKERQKRDIDICLETLTREQIYIVKCKYWHRMSWACILTNLQHRNEFKNKRAWCINTIRAINKVAIQNMDNLLKQMYEGKEFLLYQF